MLHGALPAARRRWAIVLQMLGLWHGSKGPWPGQLRARQSKLIPVSAFSAWGPDAPCSNRNTTTSRRRRLHPHARTKNTRARGLLHGVQTCDLRAPPWRPRAQTNNPEAQSSTHRTAKVTHVARKVQTVARHAEPVARKQAGIASKAAALVTARWSASRAKVWELRARGGALRATVRTLCARWERLAFGGLGLARGSSGVGC